MVQSENWQSLSALILEDSLLRGHLIQLMDLLISLPWIEVDILEEEKY